MEKCPPGQVAIHPNVAARKCTSRAFTKFKPTDPTEKNGATKEEMAAKTVTPAAIGAATTLATRATGMI